MPKFGDILPSASGRSHIGVDEGVVVGSFDTSSIAPFGHIHQLSGIFHDSVNGNSGILSFNGPGRYFSTSRDGGLSHGFHFGGENATLDIQFSSTENVGSNKTIGVGGSLDISSTGNLNISTGSDGTIDLGTIGELSSSILSIYGDAIAIFTNASSTSDLDILTSNAASDLNITGLGRVKIEGDSGNTTILIDTGGLLDINGRTADIDFTGAVTLDSLTLAITNAGTSSWSAGILALNGNSAFSVGSLIGTSAWSSATDTLMLAGGKFEIFSGRDVLGDSPKAGDDIALTSSNQLTLSAFANPPSSGSPSGQLHYQFGPNEGWAVKPSYTNIFHVLPHSGQVSEMIRKDIIPFASGIHSLGGTSLGNFQSAKPYGKVHQASGIFVDPTLGAWGGFRYSRRGTMHPGSGQLEYTINSGNTWEPLTQFTITQHAYSTATLSAGGSFNMISVNDVSTNSRVMVPSGMTMHILAIEGHCRIPSTAAAGNYIINYGIRDYDSNNENENAGTVYYFTQSSGPRGLHHAYAQGTMAKPLLTLPGGKTWKCRINSDASNPGSVASGNPKQIIIVYKYVKDNSSSIQL